MAKEDEDNLLDRYNQTLGNPPMRERVGPNSQATINQANTALDKQFSGRMIPPSSDYEVGTIRGYEPRTTGLVPGSTALDPEQQAAYDKLGPREKALFDQGFSYLQNMTTPTNAQSSSDALMPDGTKREFTKSLGPDNDKTIYDTSSGTPVDVTDQYRTDLFAYSRKYELNPIQAMLESGARLSDEQVKYLEESGILQSALSALLDGEKTGMPFFVDPYGDPFRNADQAQQNAESSRIQSQLDNMGYTGNLLKDFDLRSPTSIPVSLVRSGLKKLENLFGTSEENNNQINMQSGEPETDTADAGAITDTNTGAVTSASTDTDPVISTNTEPKSDPKPKIKKEEKSTDTSTSTATDTATSDDEVVATGSVENPFASGDLNYEYEVTKSDLRILQNSGIFNNRGLTNKQVFDFVGEIKSSGVGVLEYVSFSNQMRTDPSRKKEFDSLETGKEQGAYIRYQNALEDMQSRNLGQRFGIRTDKEGNVSLTKEGQKRVFLQQLGKDIFVEGKFSMSEVDPNKMFEDKGDGRINFSLEEYSALINKRASMLERLQTNYEAQNQELLARQAQQQQKNLIEGQKLQGHYATLTGTRIARDGTSFTPIEKIEEIITLQEQLEETQDPKTRKEIEKNIRGLKNNFRIKDLDIRAFDYIKEHNKTIAKNAGSQ